MRTPPSLESLPLLANQHERASCIAYWTSMLEPAPSLPKVANVSPSTASVHLNRLKAERLIKVLVQGRHHYFSLQGPEVASVLEGLSVLAGGSRGEVRAKHAESLTGRADLLRSHSWHVGRVTPRPVQDAGVVSRRCKGSKDSYDVTLKGTKAFEVLGD